jgi:hypothetical protein
MKGVKSPGGSTFPYYYKGGEIHCLKYGSYFKDQEKLFAVMKAEENFIIKTNRQLRIWVDFYETRKTKRVFAEFLESLNLLGNQIIKLSIVGFSFLDKWRFKKLKKQIGMKDTIPIKYFNDPEDAKTWLVSENSSS